MDTRRLESVVLILVLQVLDSIERAISVVTRTIYICVEYSFNANDCRVPCNLSHKSSTSIAGTPTSSPVLQLYRITLPLRLLSPRPLAASDLKDIHHGYGHRNAAKDRTHDGNHYDVTLGALKYQSVVSAVVSLWASIF